MSRRPLARDKQFMIGATTVFSGRPQVSGGGGQARDVALEGWDIESMSFAKLRAGQLRVDETLTVGTPGAQRVDIIGSTSDGGIKAYDSGNNLTGQWASQSGALWSKSGGFGGTLADPSWSLSVSGIIHEDGASSAGMAPADYPFYAGNTFANRATAPYRVSAAGALVATSATITGAITATSGAIGGFDIGAEYVRDAANSFGMASTVTGSDDVRFWAGDTFANRSTTADVRIFESGIIHLGSNAATYLVLDGPNVQVRSSDYVSGVVGWNIQPSSAEFANAFIRGELHSTIFVKDLIEAHAGSMAIAKSAGVLANDMAVPGAGTWTIYLNDPPGGAAFLFSVGDIVRCKTEYSGGVGDIWFTVGARFDNGDGTQRYEGCTWQSGTRSITYPAGSPIIDYGASGQGYLFMSADLANAPYYDVRTHAGAPWTTETLKVRLGLLTGVNHPVTGAPLTGIYGLWTDSGYFTGTIVASSGTIGGWTLGATTITGVSSALILDKDIGVKVLTGAILNNRLSWWNAFNDTYPAGRIWGDSANSYFVWEKVNPSTGATQSWIELRTTSIYIGVALTCQGITQSTGNISAFSRIYPGADTPGGIQSTRYLYDTGTYIGVNGGLDVNGEIRNNAIIRTTGVAATHLASSGGLEFLSGNLRIRSQGADASTKGGFTFLGITSDGSADTTFMTIANTGNVTISSLAGTGSRAVVADANGVLSAP